MFELKKGFLVSIAEVGEWEVWLSRFLAALRNDTVFGNDTGFWVLFYYTMFFYTHSLGCVIPTKEESCWKLASCLVWRKVFWLALLKLASERNTKVDSSLRFGMTRFWVLFYYTMFFYTLSFGFVIPTKEESCLKLARCLSWRKVFWLALLKLESERFGWVDSSLRFGMTRFLGMTRAFGFCFITQCFFTHSLSVLSFRRRRNLVGSWRDVWVEERFFG